MKVGITSSLDVVSPSFQSCAKARCPDKATTSINLLRVNHIVLTTPPSSQKQTSSYLESMSALPPIADMCSALADVRYGPKADISAGKLAGNPTRGCPQGSHVVRQSRAVARVCWMTCLSLLVNCVGPGSIANLLSVPVKRKGGW